MHGLLGLDQETSEQACKQLHLGQVVTPFLIEEVETVDCGGLAVHEVEVVGVCAIARSDQGNAEA